MMQPSSTRLGEVVDALVAGWRTTLAPSGWTVVDGPLTGATGALVVAVGTGNDADADPYRVDVTEHDMSGGHRENGVIRCQLAVVVSDGRDPKPSRDVALAALATLGESLRSGGDGFVLDGVADDAHIGSQRWWHLESADQSAFVVSVDFDVHWAAWI